MDSLPDGLTVKGNLNIIGSKITSLPKGLSVGTIHLNPKRLNLPHIDLIGVNSKTIFAAELNGFKAICTEDFVGTAEEFCHMMETKLKDPKLIERYRNMAYQLIGELG